MSFSPFSKCELEDFLSFCNDQDLIVIPLVQTFGHLEVIFPMISSIFTAFYRFQFVLKQEQFRALRENIKYPMTICPSLDESGMDGM